MSMFNFTDTLDRLIRHITAVCPEFAHVDMDRVAVAYIQARTPGVHGVYASCQPLFFKDGASTTTHRGRTYSMPKVTRSGVEMRYILYFALPRFQNLDFEAKMNTVFHELYHISPEFNGDIRRFPGRNYAHGSSRKKFNESVKTFVQEYLSHPDAAGYTAFLQKTFEELSREHGRIVGIKIRPPKPVRAG